MKVYIAQLKCPSNHCVVAKAGEFANSKLAESLGTELRLLFDLMVARGALIYECGICKSKDLHVQIAPTRFRTMEEARPFLNRSEVEQIASAEFLRGGRN